PRSTAAIVLLDFAVDERSLIVSCGCGRAFSSSSYFEALEANASPPPISTAAAPAEMYEYVRYACVVVCTGEAVTAAIGTGIFETVACACAAGGGTVLAGTAAGADAAAPPTGGVGTGAGAAAAAPTPALPAAAAATEDPRRDVSGGSRTPV